MKAVLLLLTALLLVGCEERYRYPCQDEANKDNPECNRPACEKDGFCYDSLNGLPPKQAAEPQVDEAPAVEPAVENENTGE